MAVEVFADSRALCAGRRRYLFIADVMLQVPSSIEYGKL